MRIQPRFIEKAGWCETVACVVIVAIIAVVAFLPATIYIAHLVLKDKPMSRAEKVAQMYKLKEMGRHV